MGRIPVSMRDLLLEAAFGPVRLGISQTEVEDLLGEPDAEGGVSRKYRRGVVWKYGDIELHWATGAKDLWMFFCDDFEVLDGGEQVSLDPWFLRGHLSRQEVEEALSREGIARREVDRSSWQTGRQEVIELGAGARLSFIDDEYGSGLRVIEVQQRRS